MSRRTVGVVHTYARNAYVKGYPYMCGRWQELEPGGEPAPGGAAAFNALVAAAGWAEGTVHNGGSLSMRLANSLGEAAAGMAEYARRLVEDASNTAAAAACLRAPRAPAPHCRKQCYASRRPLLRLSGASLC